MKHSPHPVDVWRIWDLENDVEDHLRRVAALENALNEAIIALESDGYHREDVEDALMALYIR